MQIVLLGNCILFIIPLRSTGLRFEKNLIVKDTRILIVIQLYVDMGMINL